MFLKYAEWMVANVWGTGYGLCSSYSKDMAEAFPELRRCRGYYHCPQWGARTHWWLETPVGEVIDPTARQFPSLGHGRYEELSDEYIEEHLPSGKCYNCGEYIYKGDYTTDCVCSEECHKEYAAYCLNPN